MTDLIHILAVGIGGFVVSLAMLWHFRNYRKTGDPFRPLSDEWKEPKGNGRWQ